MWSERKGMTGDAEEQEAYEFDVRLKVWRRSRANIWMSPDR